MLWHKNFAVRACWDGLTVLRKVRTASGAVAVQVVTRRGRQVEGIEHVGSAHTDAELVLLLAAARERLAAEQEVLDLGEMAKVSPRMREVADWTRPRELSLPRAAGGPQAAAGGGGRVVGTSADLLWAVLISAYARLGFDVLDDRGIPGDGPGADCRADVQGQGRTGVEGMGARAG